MTLPYGATVLDHFRRPRNQRALEHPSVAREGVNPLCGDRVRLELEIERDVIRSAAFTANACAICTAAASLLTDRIRGFTLSQASAITDAEMLDVLGTALPPARLACGVLPLRTLRDALAHVRTLA